MLMCFVGALVVGLGLPHPLIHGFSAVSTVANNNWTRCRVSQTHLTGDGLGAGVWSVDRNFAGLLIRISAGACEDAL